jgi:hypothetical protein
MGSIGNAISSLFSLHGRKRQSYVCERKKNHTLFAYELFQHFNVMFKLGIKILLKVLLFYIHHILLGMFFLFCCSFCSFVVNLFYFNLTTYIFFFDKSSNFITTYPFQLTHFLTLKADIL